MPPKIVKVVVTLQRTYLFTEGEVNGWSPENVVEDWFVTHNINHAHATRDAMHVGGSDKVIAITVNETPVSIPRKK